MRAAQVGAVQLDGQGGECDRDDGPHIRCPCGRRRLISTTAISGAIPASALTAVRTAQPIRVA
uniref:Uncharacterized protein n=1 Tax=Nonomuraea gerenzanensis TaxID=93944 RepID=A0A1M4EB24_9ACTN|nr:hypothetical protein BN4615_P5673 [Nonomuraea gerenzanensis]